MELVDVLTAKQWHKGEAIREFLEAIREFLDPRLLPNKC